MSNPIAEVLEKWKDAVRPWRWRDLSGGGLPLKERGKRIYRAYSLARKVHDKRARKQGRELFGDALDDNVARAAAAAVAKGELTPRRLLQPDTTAINPNGEKVSIAYD